MLLWGAKKTPTPSHHKLLYHNLTRNLKIFKKLSNLLELHSVTLLPNHLLGYKSSVKRQKGESQNGDYKKKYAKFSEKGIFLTP